MRAPNVQRSELYIESARSFLLHLIGSWALRNGSWKERAAASTEDEPLWKILRYQRILDIDSLTQPIIREAIIRPETFRMHLTTLSNECRVISLRELVDSFIEGRPMTEPTAVLTFDGGRPEHYSIALPMLREFKLPATFFLPTGYIDSHNAFWEEKIVFGLVALGQRGKSFDALQTVPDEFKRTILELTPSDQTITIERAMLVLEYLEFLPPEERAPLFQELGLAVESTGGLTLERQFLTWSEVDELAKDGFTIGSMTHQRLRFAESNNEGILADLSASYAAIEARGINPTPVLSLPDGILPEEAASFLGEKGVMFVLGGDTRFAFPLRGVTVLPRTPVLQHGSHTPGRFIAEIWPVAPRWLRR